MQIKTIQFCEML